MTEFEVAWARPPEGIRLYDVPGVEVDGEDRVYAFSRGAHGLAIFESDGGFVRSWGPSLFTNPHGVRIDGAGLLYLTDEGDHTVRRCTPDGDVLLTIGTPSVAAPFMSGQPFYKPTNVSFGPEGDIFVADGYGNAHVHRFTPDGELIRTWGGSGSDPGQFYIPHDVRCDTDGWVYVADRENHRIQVFDGEGRVEAVWGNLHRPAGLALLGEGRSRRVYVAELAPMFRSGVPFAPNLGARITVLDGGGAVIARHGSTEVGTAPDQFLAPHGIAVDSHGDVYVGEVSNVNWPTYQEGPLPPDLTTLRKLTRLSA